MTDELKKQFEEIADKFKGHYGDGCEWSDVLEAMHLAYQMGEKKRSEEIIKLVTYWWENDDDSFSELLTKIKELK